MLKKYLENIENNDDKKSALLELKTFLKESDKSGKDFSGNEEDLLKAATELKKLLSDEDPKIRKNCAICLGVIGEAAGSKEIAEALYDAYICEQTNYNKAAYLEALGRLDHSSVTEGLGKKRKDIIDSDISINDKKHVIEEMHELNIILRRVIGKTHEFTGFSLVNEAALLTNRNFKKITINELGNIPHKEFPAGVMVKTKNIRKVTECRTFSEMLFIPDKIRTVEYDAQNAAETLIDGGLVQYLADRHSNPDAPFYFRVELRNRDEKKNAEFEKKLAGEIEFASRWKLINSTSDYDIELRFVENSSGKLQFLIGMKTLADTRFDYRKRTISAGMKPSLAALLIHLSKDHLKDNAVVLDPMCGSGIFLVERDRFKPARILYGVDIFGDGIAAAKDNIKAAGLSKKCELINKDILEFRHQYRFDEIIVDMPRVSSGKDRASLERLYMDFLKKASEFLEDDGCLFIYTHNRDILRKYALNFKYSIIAEFEISKMEEAYYFILKR